MMYTNDVSCSQCFEGLVDWNEKKSHAIYINLMMSIKEQNRHIRIELGYFF